MLVLVVVLIVVVACILVVEGSEGVTCDGLVIKALLSDMHTAGVVQHNTCCKVVEACRKTERYFDWCLWRKLHPTPPTPLEMSETPCVVAAVTAVIVTVALAVNIRLLYNA